MRAALINYLPESSIWSAWLDRLERDHECHYDVPTRGTLGAKAIAVLTLGSAEQGVLPCHVYERIVGSPIRSMANTRTCATLVRICVLPHLLHDALSSTFAVRGFPRESRARRSVRSMPLGYSALIFDIAPIPPAKLPPTLQFLRTTPR
jgi:hypothetical protein